jgi:general secretion pathway protein G
MGATLGTGGDAQRPTAAGRAGTANDGRAARAHRRRQSGYTLLELIAVIAVLGTLLAIFAPGFFAELRRNKVERAIVDLRILVSEIRIWGEGQAYPDSLDQLETTTRRDPWGQPYQYLRIEGSNRGQWRKDRFLVPLNSDYDLYSMGPDGKSRPPLTAAVSRDDIVRAGDGAFIGPAEEY